MSDEIHEDELQALKHVETPAPSAAARRRALAAAMVAFDAEQQKSKTPAKGNGWAARLRSIVPQGNWIMDTRFTYGIGTAAVALLLLPLGYQLYTTTAVTPLSDLPALRPEAVRQAEPPAAPESGAEADFAVAAREESEAAPAPAAPMAAKQAGERLQRAAEAPVRAIPEAADGHDEMLAAESAAAGSADAVAVPVAAPAPQPMLAVPTEPTGDVFTRFDESPVQLVAEAPVSTFSVDVDTASYAYVRRSLHEGQLPAPEAVRIEELVNYFTYDYPQPTAAAVPFQPTMQVMPTPWNADTQLLQIGIKGYAPPVTEARPSNLVFLVDTSGSMDEPDKLPLLKRALGLLVGQLDADDTIAIVAYAGSAGVVLEPTAASDKTRILGALDNLWAGGSTAGAAGIELAYRLAAEQRVEGGINRVILATDGDFNVGIEDPEALESFIADKRDAGIFLSVLGFGQGNLGDDTMQALAQNGNGVAAYIDSFQEARKVLVEQVGGTLETIATDVKIQVEFNPAVVSEYRLVGYETRALNREDFNNDRVDAGDVGAGHTVTALYEIVPVGAAGGLIEPLRYETPAAALPTVGTTDEYGFLKLRYKLPGEEASRLIEAPITRDLAVESLAAAPADARWAAAVAAFGQKLKGSRYAGDLRWDEIRSLAQGARGADENGYRAEFIQLVDAAAALAPHR
ncbi:MAG TPA: VWA domain-containing protein [Devosiaceae bacterium]|jgi:Ca-activated chloride channel family protein|nr:VWA domain-containing protein [Devosiaceae bacterium]